MKKETGRWVRKAEADLAGADDLAHAVGPYAAALRQAMKVRAQIRVRLGLPP